MHIKKHLIYSFHSFKSLLLLYIYIYPNQHHLQQYHHYTPSSSPPPPPPWDGHQMRILKYN